MEAGFKVGDFIRLKGEGWEEAQGSYTRVSQVLLSEGQDPQYILCPDPFGFEEDEAGWEINYGDPEFEAELVIPRLTLDPDASPALKQQPTHDTPSLATGGFTGTGEGLVGKVHDAAYLGPFGPRPSGARTHDTPYNYYLLPNGVEAKDISGHLSSFAGQIVQYAIRSGRMDGKVKSSEHRAQDFDKIADFAKWEAERLREHDA